MHGFLVILPVVLVMAAGRMLARRGVVSPEAFTQINKAIYWTAIPALILRMTSMADMSALADRNMVVAVYLSFLAAPPAAWLIGKLAGQERRRTASSTLMLIRSNTVFVGLPVVTVAVGLQGVEVLSLAAGFAAAEICGKPGAVGKGERAFTVRQPPGNRACVFGSIG